MDESRERLITHDILKNSFLLSDKSDYGIVEYIEPYFENDDVDDNNKKSIKTKKTVFGETSHNISSIKDDPNSGEIINDHVYNINFDDNLNICIKTHSSLKSNIDNFIVLNTLSAYDNDGLVFSKEWNKEIKREYV